MQVKLIFFLKCDVSNLGFFLRVQKNSEILTKQSVVIQ